MTARTLDAATLAARMNARPLPEDCDGGVWRKTRAHGSTCEGCQRVMSTYEMAVVTDCGGGVIDMCLPCALADCERAEAIHHEANLLEGGQV